MILHGDMILNGYMIAHGNMILHGGMILQVVILCGNMVLLVIWYYR